MKHPLSHVAITKLISMVAIVVSILTTTTTHAEVTIVNGTNCSLPERTITIENNTIVVTYNFSEVLEHTSQTDTTLIYHTIPGFGQCSEIGKPILPMRIDTFRIPAGFSMAITSTQTNPKVVNCHYIGATTPIADSSNDASTFIETDTFEGTYPSATSAIASTYILRGESIVDIAVCPIQYNYEDKKATISEQITYRLSFTPTNSFSSDSMIVGQGDNINPQSDEYLDQFLANSLITNANEIGDINQLDSEGFEGTVGYIIVTTNSYLHSIKGFERWKKILGYTTHVISSSDWTDGQEVLSAIRECRAENDNIKYILIVGDLQDVPSIQSNRISQHFTDLPFGTLTDQDILPDIYIGRVPVNNISEATETLNKLIDAEMCPVISDTFYNTAAHCAKFEIVNNKKNKEERRFILTSEEIRDYVCTHGVNAQRFYTARFDANPQFYSDYYSFGQAIPAELQKPFFDWTCSSSQIADKINNGCLYTFYRGHGLTTGWEGVGFYNGNLDLLNNYELYPTIFSITCLTGKFSHDCFAERILKLPDAGASAVIAASEVSYSGYNDSLAEGIIDAIWPNPGLIPRFNRSGIGSTTTLSQPVYRLGQILEQGLFRMKEQWGTISNYTVLYQYEVFHIFGDPSKDFFTANPTSFSNVDITRNENGIFVTTNGELASISFYNEETDESYRYETDNIFFPTTDEAHTIVCLTGHNKLTYLDGISTPTSAESEIQPTIMSYKTTGNSTTNVKVLTGNTTSDVDISVCDIYGRYRHTKSLSCSEFPQSVDLPLTDAKGVYIITLSANGKIIETKKIIQ